MSCEIRLTASIQNIPSIRRCLFPTDDKRGNDFWLHTCKISASPTGDLIALANERRLVVLNSKWDSLTASSSFQTVFSDSIHAYDKVRDILCLPIVGESNSSHVGPDWTCVVLGFDSGYVRFYTDNGDLLLEEQFHNENITSIKCQSQHNPRPDLCPELHPEELYIQYQSNICVVIGQQLFENLRHFRTQLARVQAKGSPVEFKPLPLNVRKWGFQDQALINDVVVVGLNMTNTFDHLLTAAICGGFDAKYRSTAPNSTLVLAAGSKPFLGYHYALEGVNQPVFSDVAKVVANKLKSALPGWLTGTKNEQNELTIAMQPVDNMGLRFGLSDLRRTCTAIVLSPTKKLAALSDSLGRVLLVDSYKGIVLKVFKGYREAQCAFLQVPDERRSKHRPGNKVATFLAIYSPKKGTLEIFTVQHGTKIATFSTSKCSRLLYITHGLMGFTTTTKSRYICQFTCIFLDKDGQIREIMVPFHFALAEKNSVRAKDIYLYKKLRQSIKTGECLESEIYNVCTELKTIELKTQTLELLLSSKDMSPEGTLRCVNYFLSHVSGKSEAATFDIMCKNVKTILELYVFSDDNDETEKSATYNEAENGKLNLNPRDLSGLQKLLDLAISSSDNDLKTPRVRFSNETSFSSSDFLSSFELTKTVITLKSAIEEHQKFKTSEIIFSNYILGKKNNFETLSTILKSSGLPVKDFFDLVIDFWVNRPLDITLNLEADMSNFLKTINVLIKITDKDVLISDDDETSLFWENIRKKLANNVRPFSALMAAILCKNVVQKYEAEHDEENIEVLTQENVQWSLLIGKLEDVSMLCIILSIKPAIRIPSLPCLTHSKVPVSLQYILEGGKGCVSELTAQWLTSCGVDPYHIAINEIIFKNNQTGNDEQTHSPVEDLTDQITAYQISEGMHLESIDQVKSEAVFKYLNLLKEQFPYSLEVSNLLANMCWEYALAWRKEITIIDNLRAALKCLNSVPDTSVKMGLFQLVWNAHLKIVVESSSKLINKVGKLPKDRLCQQDTGLSDKQIAAFIGICVEFMDSYLEVLQRDCGLTKRELKFEVIWENEGPQALIELAINQKEVDFDLVHLHYQLCLVLYMMTRFAVKHSKPVNSLFEASLINLLFTDFQRQVEINWNKSDIKTNSSRDQFLRKIITSSLETVSLNEEGQIYCKEHVEWMDKCLTLARIWNLGVDSLRRFQIAQLYTGGYDLIAQDLIPAVSDRTLLGEELLKVAANRLSQYLSSSPNLSENIAALSPILSRYIESVNGSWCSPSDLNNIKTLAKHALDCIGANERELLKLAELVVDACRTLQDINVQ
ncbi:rab3 GTPase-activating protein non-catalytic subunit [Euwallacea similis]|uniref:rab3 GTPase-activating protein non-catalytic subunit n=1 Tax=Euwallacea similis TaxID=1736056 RepID=UPI00344B48BB